MVRLTVMAFVTDHHAGNAVAADPLAGSASAVNYNVTVCSRNHERVCGSSMHADDRGR